MNAGYFLPETIPILINFERYKVRYKFDRRWRQ